MADTVGADAVVEAAAVGVGAVDVVADVGVAAGGRDCDSRRHQNETRLDCVQSLFLRGIAYGCEDGDRVECVQS